MKRKHVTCRICKTELPSLFAPTCRLIPSGVAEGNIEVALWTVAGKSGVVGLWNKHRDSAIVFGIDINVVVDKWAGEEAWRCAFVNDGGIEGGFYLSVVGR